MSLIVGTHLGSYEILAAIGEGGMGEVYRARDKNLNRDVAIKVLRSAVVNDPDRLARFTREAQTLAALNHPNIAHIHGLEESGGVRALVMELVEGDDLSQRIERLRAKGSGLPIDEVLPIAKQIAEALEAAHEQGIIHRDLKPANIKVRPDGTVKVLDFGLAKAMDVGSGGSGGFENSPTLSLHATMAGVILGTAAYMSPEQARGKSVDKRADIWAFGVVLFEMLTGRRAFRGEDITDTIVSVVGKEPDWGALPASTPVALRRLIARCLKKDAKARMRDIGEARLQIEELISGAPDDGAAGVANPQSAIRSPQSSTAGPVSAWRRALPWAVAAGALIAAGVALWSPWRSSPVPTPRKLLASIGADASLPTDRGASAILSPDGTLLAFVGQQAGQTRLFVRKLDQLQATALAGTEGAANPFFSPDGQWIAFFSDGKLKKISVTGGASIDLCDAPNNRGGTWADDDSIIFTPVNGPNVTLVRVSAAGGTPAAFSTLSKGALTQRWPQALHGGKGVLFSEHSAVNGWDSANLVVVPLSGGAPKIVVRGGHYGRYVPSHLGLPKQAEGGHLIYMKQDTLFAVRFDLDRLETVGQAVPAIEGVSANAAVSGGAQLAVSSDGTLVYMPGAGPTRANSTDWMTREGKTSVLRATKAAWSNPRFSPDGQKLALEISDGKQSDIWVYEWARDTLTQLTFDAGQDQFPTWTPDGRRIVFASDRAKTGISNLYWVNADGTGDVTRLTDSSDSHLFPAWHPDGKFLAFNAIRPGTGNDLMILPMERDGARGWTPGKPTAFLGTPASEAYPMFSPDGRWIAYQSNEAAGSRNNDVYVRPFPGPGGKWRVSTEGGLFPHWSATAHELLFTTTQGNVMFAPYAVVGDSFRAEKPQVWSPTSILNRVTNSPYDLHPDGKRLATAAAQDQSSAVQDKVVFVFNFGEYLRQLTATKT